MSALLTDPKAALRELDRLDCERSHLRFVERFFRAHRGSPLVVGPHHAVIAETLDRVFSGEIKRLIINIPPRFSKTEMAVVHFIAHGFALNPRANFIHASFNAQLALNNSDAVRAVMKLPQYQELWPTDFSATSDAKGVWKTAAGGGMLAAAAGGPITGFGAGLMEPGFTGALIIDDPLKPDDAKSEIERANVNDRWDTTFKSRLALEDVPVIVIMQRLHVDDFCGFLLKGGAGCRWHHLLLPVEIDSGAPYPSEYTHGLPINHGLPDGPLWPFKLNAEQIAILKIKADVFAGQFKQQPIVSGGNLFKEEWLIGYTDLPEITYRWIYVDTAEKTGQRNDYSVFQCWGMGQDGRAYLLDQDRGKFEAPELLTTARAVWKKHSDPKLNELGFCRGMKIEEKSAGTGLIQSLKRTGPNGEPPVPVIAVQRDRDKERRANNVLPSFAIGLIRVPKDAPWYDDWKNEILAFPNGAHDDQVDATMDAAADLVLGGNALSLWEALGAE